jgi:hypothetical protein
MENQDLCKVAMDNLLFLSKGEKFITNKYKLNNLRFESSEDETFDTIYSLKELEYPLYFTINQLLTDIHTSYEYYIQGYHRKDIINMLDDVVEMLYQYYEGCEENNPLFELFLDDIDYKVFFTQGYYKYGICHWIPTKLSEYLNWFCIRSIKISKEIVYDYLDETYSPGRYDESSDEDSVDKDEEVNKSKLTRSKSEEELLLTGEPVVTESSADEESDQELNSKKLD